MAQVVEYLAYQVQGPEFNTQFCKKKNKRKKKDNQNSNLGQVWCPMSIIPATQEAEAGGPQVPGQSGQHGKFQVSL
jgi:hypothetical protein